MNTKLTLRLDNNVIEKAKIYAKSHNVSLSKMIETYLDSLTSEKDIKEAITPLVESLSGVMELPADYDYKKERADYVINKYR
jgi:antitoxin component of RelBE/YafQ-DinJ toxin-antitoxin module